MTDFELATALRGLADLDSRAGEPLAKCMREAASRLEALSFECQYLRKSVHSAATKRGAAQMAKEHAAILARLDEPATKGGGA